MNDLTHLDSPIEHRFVFRVHYHETDGQGRVHNSQYLNYFERGRVEMLRSFGISYRELEETGLMLVVKTMQVEFHQPAQFDDELTLITSLLHCHGVRIEHGYRIVRSNAAGDSPIVSGRSVIVCIDRSGKVCRLPKNLQQFKTKDRPETPA